MAASNPESGTYTLMEDSLHAMANAIRALSMDAVQKANSGHPGMPMGMADAATVLFANHLIFNPDVPDWPNRDRFVLSAGHGSMLLYALLHLTGYSRPTIEDLKNFRQLHSPTAGHPEYGELPGVEVTTGPLGQGLATAVGLALGERMSNARHGDKLVNHYTYVIAGDGCLMEGVSHEAIGLAGHLNLSKLIVLFDDNSISIDGGTDLSTSEDTVGRFEAAGWHVQRVDGHDTESVDAALSAAKETDQPSLIACRTTIGFGSPNKAGTSGAHGSPLGDDEIALVRKAINWPYPAFEVPDDIRKKWQSTAHRGQKSYQHWLLKCNELSSDVRALYDASLKAVDPEVIDGTLGTLITDLYNNPQNIATRKASQNALEAFVPVMPSMIGGSADLTGSNLTKASSMTVVTPDNFNGQYIHYGVREFGMAAAMNGLALYGGFIPFGGTFLVFTDYARPAIRLGALMGIQVIYVMTHDSIGLGEDGPTHQPIEHLASLRAMPNTVVLRPADTVETAEAWAIALKRTEGPTILSLSRQSAPQLRLTNAGKNLSERGGYILEDSAAPPKVTLIATGTEVGLAKDVKDALRDQGISARLVSMPSTDLFLQQDDAYRHSVLGDALKVSIEAATSYGWHQIIGTDGIACGIDSFGASAPAKDLYAHFGLTPEIILAKIKNRL